MKISIITVSYNSSKTIKETIESVICQTYNNVEYIIIDGNSKDNTIDIIKIFGSEINTLISEPDLGIYDAMNKGIALATGDIIGILNSDDLYYDKYVIASIMNEFIINKNLDIIFGNLVYVKENDTNRVVRKWISKPIYDKYFDYADVPPHPTLFVKKHVYKSVGKFNIKYKLAADYELMLRIFKKFNYNSKHLPIFLIKMRLGGATNKSIKNIISGNLEILNAWKDNGFRIPFYFFPLKIIKRIIQFF